MHKAKNNTFNVKEWGLSGVIRVLPKDELAAVKNYAAGKPDLNPDHVLLSHCLVSTSGERFFQDSEIPILSKRSKKIVDSLVTVVKTEHGLTKQKGNSNDRPTGKNT